VIRILLANSKAKQIKSKPSVSRFDESLDVKPAHRRLTVNWPETTAASVAILVLAIIYKANLESCRYASLRRRARQRLIELVKRWPIICGCPPQVSARKLIWRSLKLPW
jgi:hypothetical protein